MRAAGIVLAAGASRRMGRPKMTLPFGGSTVLETVIRSLSAGGVESVVVVLGHHWQEVHAAIQHLDVGVIVNPRPERGMTSSLQWALAQASEGAEGWVVALGDQPQMDPGVVRELIRAACGSSHGFVVPTFQGRRGHPLLMRARLKEAVLSLPHDQGLNTLLRARPREVLEVPVETASILRDMDTPEDYRNALAQ